MRRPEQLLRKHPKEAHKEFRLVKTKRTVKLNSFVERRIKSVPARRTLTLGARNVMNMKAARTTNEVRITLFMPNRETSIPFRRTPKNAPTPEALLRPDCQAAVN